MEASIITLYYLKFHNLHQTIRSKHYKVEQGKNSANNLITNINQRDQLDFDGLP